MQTSQSTSPTSSIRQDKPRCRTLTLLKRQAPVYLLCLCAFVLSTFLTIVLDLQTLALGSVGALTAALFELVRDNARHQRELELQQGSQSFDLAIASHMAQRVFDKHVEYVEAYMAELHDILEFLLTEGPCVEVQNYVNKLAVINRKFAAWVPSEVRKALRQFEADLFAIGQHSFVAMHDAELRASERSKAYDLIVKLIATDTSAADQASHVEGVKREIRAMLGIEYLYTARLAVLQKSPLERRGWL